MRNIGRKEGTKHGIELGHGEEIGGSFFLHFVMNPLPHVFVVFIVGWSRTKVLW
jgi:hypothetical protein